MSGFFAPRGHRRTYVKTADLGVAWFTVFTTLVATGASLLVALVGLRSTNSEVRRP
jgi:hypothetical protein